MTTQETLSPTNRHDTQHFDRIRMAREGLDSRRAFAAPGLGATALQERVMEVMSDDDRPAPTISSTSRLSQAIANMRQARENLVSGGEYRL